MGTDDQTEWELLFDDATFWNAGASALFIAGRNGRTTRKRSFKEGAVPRQGGPCKIASTPCFAPVISLFWHSEKIVQMSLSYRKSRNNLSHLAGTGPVTWQSSLYFSLLAGKPPTETGSPMTVSTAQTCCCERDCGGFPIPHYPLHTLAQPLGRVCHSGDVRCGWVIGLCSAFPRDR